MHRELIAQLKAAGHTPRSIFEGVIFAVGNVSIAFGQDGEALSAYIQIDTPAGADHSTQEGLTVASAVQLCQQYAQTAVQSVA